MIHEFHLSPPGSGRGVSCDANGAFVGDIPLLKRSIIDGRERWETRECGALSKAIGADFGLPIDMSSKMGGVRAISNALNDGDVARAQIATVLLGIPELPALSKDACSPGDLVRYIHQLQWSGLLKADWDSDEHPRWPAGAPDSQGGQFAPKGDDTTVGQTSSDEIDYTDATIVTGPQSSGEQTSAETWLDLLGSAIISPANAGTSAAQTRAAIVKGASKLVGSKLWEYHASANIPGSSAVDGPKTYKCSLFVYDVLNQAGASPGLPDGNFSWVGRGYPPTPGQWTDPSYNIPGWQVLGPHDTPQPGDVVAQRISYTDADGHVMIVGSNNTFIGTGGDREDIEQIPTRQTLAPPGVSGGPLVYRRWVGR